MSTKRDENTKIQVGIRVRPPIQRELQNQSKIVIETKENTVLSNPKDKQPFQYEFDKVFGEKSSTEEIYDNLGSPIIKSIVEGFNGTLLAYGQTASGKTHTIMGDPSDEGIIPRALKDLFVNIEKCQNREFLIRASYLEIYNEFITDLLGMKKEISGELSIRMDCSGNVYVDNLTEKNITNFEEGMQLVEQGQKNRAVGKTNMNERSSRSHCVFKLIIESRESQDLDSTESEKPVKTAELNLVDLAGSERVQQTGAIGQRFKEATYINQSLLTLGTVIQKLCPPKTDQSQEKGVTKPKKTEPSQPHIPYRDSKLTRLLQNSLGGNARTAMICCVSPVVFDESKQTLMFAARAKNVQNKPIVNEVFNEGNSQLKRQMSEIRALKRKIEELEGAQQGEMLMEQDKILAEKNMFRKKIEEQEERIHELLKAVVHSGRNTPQLSVKDKYKRRQTWAPGAAGISGLLKKELKKELKELRTIDEKEEESPFSQHTKRSFSSLRESISPMNLVELKRATLIKEEVGNDSFEKHEYDMLKEEFEEFKSQTTKNLKSSEERLCDKETETEILKNRLRDQNTECERLRESLQSLQSSSINNSNGGGMEQKAAEIEALRQEMLQLHETHTQQLSEERAKQEILKDEVKSKEERISRLRDQSDSEEWQEAMNGILNAEKKKNEELLHQMESVKQEYKALLQAQETSVKESEEIRAHLKAGEEQYQVLAQEREAAAKENEDLHAQLRASEEEYDKVKCQQENMVPGEFVEDLKKSMVRHEAEKQEYANEIEELRAIIKELKSTKDEDENDREQEKLVDTTKTLTQKIAALEEELGLNRDLIQTLESEKDQLVREKQNLVVAQMELAVSSESRTLAGDVLSDVEITGLKELNDELLAKNQLLEEQKVHLEEEKSTKEEITLDQITSLKKLNKELMAKNQVLEEEKSQYEEQSVTALNQATTATQDFQEMHKNQEALYLTQIEEHKKEKQALQEEMETLQQQLEIVIVDQQDGEVLNEEIQRLRKEHTSLQSDVGTLKDVIESNEEEMKALQEQLNQKINRTVALEEEQSMLKQQFQEKCKELEQQQLNDTAVANDGNTGNNGKLQENLDQLCQEVETLKRKYDGETTELRAQLDQKKQELQIFTNQQQPLFEEDSNKLRDDFDQLCQELQVVRQKHQEELKTVREELQIECQELKNRIQQQQQKLAIKEEVEDEVDASQTKLPRQLPTQSDLKNLQATLMSVEHEKAKLVAGFNSIKQEFMMSDFEKTGIIESLEKEIEKLKQQLEGWSAKEQESSNSYSLKIKELEGYIATNEDRTKETIGNLETCLTELTAEKESLGKRISEFSAVVGGNINNDEDIVVDTDRDALIARLEAEHQNFQDVFNVEKEKVKQLEDKNFLLETEKEEMGTKLEEMSQATARLQDELRDAKAIMSAIDLNPLLNSDLVVDDSTETIDELRRRIGEKESLLGEYAERTTELEKALQDESAPLQDQFKELEEMNVALRAEIADKIAKCEQLSLRNEDLDAKLEQAELDRIQTVANSDGATVQLDGADAKELFELREKTIEQETEFAEKVERILQLETELANFQDVFTTEKEKAKQLEEKNFVLQAEAEEKDANLEGLRTIQEKLQSNLSLMETNLANMQKELREKSEDDIAEENEYDTMVESLEQAKEENDNNAAELDSLRRELDGARAEATRLAGEAKLLRDDADVEARRERQERERLVSELKQKIEVLEENEKLGEGVIEELKKAQTELESELKQSSEECQIARQQKDGLLKHTENLKIKILNLEEDFQSLQESEMASRNLIETGREKMQNLIDIQQDLETERSALQNQLDDVRNQLSEKEELLSLELTRSETFSKAVEQLEATNRELGDTKRTLADEVEKERQLASKLEDKVTRLTETVQQEKTRYDEERILYKSAYEREKEAQSSELVRCMKNLQSENVQLNEVVAQLNQQVDELKASVVSNEHEKDKLAKLGAGKVAELDTKLEQLKQAYADEVTRLKEEIAELETTLTRQEHKTNTASNDNERLNDELTSLKQKYEELLLVSGGNDGGGGKQVEKPLSPVGKDNDENKAKIKSLSYKLKLRMEDIEVCTSRIKEQDMEINKLKETKEELKGQMKRAIKHFESVRRPSGNAETQEWELLVTDMEKKMMRLGNSNDDLAKKNKVLAGEVERYSEALLSAKAKLKEQERLLNSKQTNNFNNSRSGESVKLNEELSQKEKEIERLNSGLQKAFSRMTTAETKLKENNAKVACKVEMKDAEIKRISSGLNTAFERYKHYKGRCQEQEKDIKTLKENLQDSNENRLFLSEKLNQLDVRIRQSMKPSTSDDILQDISMSLNKTAGLPLQSQQQRQHSLSFEVSKSIHQQQEITTGSSVSSSSLSAFQPIADIKKKNYSAATSPPSMKNDEYGFNLSGFGSESAGSNKKGSLVVSPPSSNNHNNKDYSGLNLSGFAGSNISDIIGNLNDDRQQEEQHNRSLFSSLGLPSSTSTGAGALTDLNSKGVGLQKHHPSSAFAPPPSASAHHNLSSLKPQQQQALSMFSQKSAFVTVESLKENEEKPSSAATNSSPSSAFRPSPSSATESSTNNTNNNKSLLSPEDLPKKRKSLEIFESQARKRKVTQTPPKAVESECNQQ